MIDFIKKIILTVVKKNCNKFGRKSIQSDEHFLDMFIEFVKNYTKWKCLNNHYLSENSFIYFFCLLYVKLFSDG